MKQRFEKLSRSIGFFKKAFYHFREHEEVILQIRKMINCSEKEVLAFLDTFHGWQIGGLLRYVALHGDFPLIGEYEYSMCLNCRKRQWRYVGDWRGPCPHCGYYNPNIDPVFSIGLGEQVSFQSGENDIEI